MDYITTRFEMIMEKGKINQARLGHLIESSDELEDNENKSKIMEIINSLKIGEIEKNTLDLIHKFMDQYIINSTQIIKTDSDISVIEKQLDSKVKKYSGFSDKKPMDYVGYETSRNLYVFTYDNTKKRLKDKCKLCEFAVDKLVGEIQNRILISTPIQKITFKYKDQYIFAFGNNYMLMFDIQHILMMLDVSDDMQRKKYNEFSDKITHCTCVKNEFGGYIIRELIPEEVMYEIILSSNSEISKSFRKDVGLILKKIREDGKLFVNTMTGSLEYQSAIGKTPKLIENNTNSIKTTIDVLDKSVSSISCIYLFIIGQVKTLRKTMNIDVKYNDDCYVIKFGRTDDLSRRSKEHQKTFETLTNNLELKYYAWIDDVYQSKAEKHIKNYFRMMKTLFFFGDMNEIAILTKEELKETKKEYDILFQLFGGKISSMAKNYDDTIKDIKSKYNLAKGKLKKLEELIGAKNDIIKSRDDMLRMKDEITKTKEDLIHAKDNIIISKDETILQLKSLISSKNK